MLRYPNRPSSPLIRACQRLATTFVFVAFIATLSPFAAAGGIAELIARLEDGVDFRVRVQAALELGKTRNERARDPLEQALDDTNAAVRAASAAALKVLGDRRALSALEKHRDDSSPAVRSQVESTIKALSASERSPTSESKKRPEVLVQVGKFRGVSEARSKLVLDDAERASRTQLAELPGVEVLKGESEQSRAGSAAVTLPVVMVSGRVKKLEQHREGSAVVYAASVEFVLHKMPGQTIRGVVSGSAKASGSASQATNRRAMAHLRRTALFAAIESAVRRAPQALRAAATE